MSQECGAKEQALSDASSIRDELRAEINVVVQQAADSATESAAALGFAQDELTATRRELKELKDFTQQRGRYSYYSDGDDGHDRPAPAALAPRDDESVAATAPGTARPPCEADANVGHFRFGSRGPAASQMPSVLPGPRFDTPQGGQSEPQQQSSNPSAPHPQG